MAMAAAEVELSPRVLLKLAGGLARSAAEDQERQAWALALGRLQAGERRRRRVRLPPELIELELVALSGGDWPVREV
jgi:hypothetical protein